ncbi:aminotransferase class V-fold PLP-dependent enzyme [Agromyces aerolatus]|uniref:aminotransferase class V-fold PLP-dependent enzyme n=1 Tax=Agromyces sp. LY-1074 TaxID=3074080 RepID=UPI002860B5CB|nr:MULTISPECIES: aminotransferase class V-fold PLP-dependent enzyme [unclassified Agromyces]MDR5699086.1 aminotransferase class V-fold PLP-dependent enzyme [Agromyces sp. LY-1074]MDR5705136.1 aminotransferase class V-fold PLP-dependent enzyme [Agromyces sp. LY-1358]
MPQIDAQPHARPAATTQPPVAGQAPATDRPFADAEPFAGAATGRGYLAACTMGLPARATVDALRADLERWGTGTATAVHYTEVVERARAHAATLLGTGADRIALGSQVSVFAAIAAASVTPGAEVVCVDGDFSSLVAPFLVRADLRVRHVPLTALADEITARTALVAYSLVQSATGEVADAASIARAARDAGAFLLADTTQATGWLPTRDLDADLTVCHTYKWLSAPRGAAFAAFSDRALAELTPLAAGWYSGADPWTSCYGPALHLADDASRFDVSPAWQAWVGADAALGVAASLDESVVLAHDLALANAFRARLGLEASDSAIVTWPDADGDDLRTLTAAEVVASGRAGRARVAFHVWNDDEDVQLAADALGGAAPR